MTQQNLLPRILLYTTLASLAAAGLLVPRGEDWAHLFYLTALVALAAGVGAFAYARHAAIPPLRRDDTLHPTIDWQTVRDEQVPEHLLHGTTPLVAIVREGEILHTDFAATLAPNFAEPALAFIQGATRYDGTGGVAESYRELSAIADEIEAARERVGAVLLRGGGALISREALREAWRPGDTWATLGMRMQALGYRGRFEPQAMTLAWAPLTLTEYGERLFISSRSAVRTLLFSIVMRGVPIEVRIQYAAYALAPLAAWFVLLCATVSMLTLIVRDAGPIIITSPAALPMVGLAALCLGIAGWSWYRLTTLNPARPLALMLVGAGVFVSVRIRTAAQSPQVRRVGALAVEAGRVLIRSVAVAATTVRAGGSVNTAPAGTPARL